MFGKADEVPQRERTSFHPRSTYGISKVAGFHLTMNYREAYGIFGCNGILFNHESPRRGRTFVTRKITRAVADISLGKQACLYLGNLDAQRDWGHGDFFLHGLATSVLKSTLFFFTYSPRLRRGDVAHASAE